MLISRLPPTAALWAEVEAERAQLEEERREQKLAARERHYRRKGERE